MASVVLFTAPCPAGHQDASWVQRGIGDQSVQPANFEITCRDCAAGVPVITPQRLLPSPRPEPDPLVLRGYRWIRDALAPVVSG